ncbi:MAG: hypothetical protein H6Q67_2189 [Firmicutes bacterium]|nr:hypothetical protein [Bacillota bacterium]
MKNIHSFILFFCFLFLLVGCDNNEDVYVNKGYSLFKVKMLWQADASISYKYTLDNDSVGSVSSYIRGKTSGILRVFKNNETTPELEQAVTLQEGDNVVDLVQLPESPVVISPSEDDPSTAHHVKVRLFYKGIAGWGSSVKVDIYATVDRVTYTSTGVSVVLEEGKLSPYFELDLNQFFPTNTSQVVFNSDITDVATGTLLSNHTKGTNYGAIQFGTTSFDATNGWKSTNKCATSQVKKQASLFRFLLAFGIPWE